MRMAPCQRLVFQARGRFLPERLSQLKTEAKFGPSPSGRARRSLCLRHRRPPVGAAGARPAPEGCGGQRGHPAPLDSGTGAERGQDTAQQVRKALQRAKKGSGENTGRGRGDVMEIFKELSNFCAAPSCSFTAPTPCPLPSVDRVPPLPSFLPARYLAPNPCASLRKGGIHSG